MKTKLSNLFFIFLMLIVITACKKNTEVDRAVETFFMYVIQILSLTLLGIPSVILSVVGSTSKTITPKIFGGILLSIFTLITIVCFEATNEINPKKDYIYLAFVVDAFAIGVSIFYLTKSKKRVQISGQVSDTYLDKIIDGDKSEKPISQEKKKTTTDTDEMEMI